MGCQNLEGLASLVIGFFGAMAHGCSVALPIASTVALALKGFVAVPDGRSRITASASARGGV